MQQEREGELTGYLGGGGGGDLFVTSSELLFTTARMYQLASISKASKFYNFKKPI